MKITLDAEVIAAAITEYLDAKGFEATKVELKTATSSSYGPVIAEVELKAEEEAPGDPGGAS